MYKEFDVVSLLQQRGSIPAGSLGAIIHVFDESHFLVEFVDSNVETIDVITVSEADIVPTEHPSSPG